MDPIIEIEGGDVLANLEDRTITGRLIPFGEEGRTNVGRLTVEAGTITLPTDPLVVGLNTDHERADVVGRATRVWEQADGIYATWQIARTPEGDAALADATNPAGRRTRLSGEFGPAVVRAGKLVAGHARLWGSALVARGAFPSAMVLAEDTPDPDEQSPVDPQAATAATTEGDPTMDETTETVAETTTAVLAAEQPVPATQTLDTAPTVQARMPAMRDVFAAFAAVRSPIADAADREAGFQVLAALDDITTSGLLDGGDVARVTWLGQLYQGIPYTREYITLGVLGTALSLAGKQGYTLHRGTAASPVSALGGNWTGNKTAIASGKAFTKSHASDPLERYAFGADIAREFFDIPGGEEAVAEMFKLVLEDHLIWSDEIALSKWRLTAGLPVTNDTYPSVDGHDYDTALGQLIQGVLAVKAKKGDGRRDTPSFAIVNELAYKQLIYTPKDLVPEFVRFTASTDWTGTGDGLRLVVGDTGITSTSSVIVGDGRSIQFDELAGGPLRVDAVDLAKGGVDRAIHGYLQTFRQRPEAVVHIGTPDARANTTVYSIGDLAKVSAVVYQAVAAGTSSGTAPTAPAVGATVDDGTVTWLRLV